MFSLTSLNDVYKYLFSMSTRLGSTRSDPTQIVKYLQFSREPKGIYRYLYLNVSIKYHSPSKLACEGGGGEAGRYGTGVGCWVDFFLKRVGVLFTIQSCFTFQCIVVSSWGVCLLTHWRRHRNSNFVVSMAVICN